MKNPGDTLPSRNNSGLLSLAFACNEMVSQLSKGLKLEFQGDHKSAMAELDTVRSEIDSWIDRLDNLEEGEVNKDQLVGNLREAKHAVNLDIQD